MLRHLLKANDIDVTQFGLTLNDMKFIEEIILGIPERNRVGRDQRKFFLYDIVNNNRSGLDVDKLDYFQRDMKVFISTIYDPFLSTELMRMTLITGTHNGNL